MRILVTGASGFIGSRLARALAEDGHEVWGTTLSGGAVPSSITALELDLRDERRVAAAVEAARPEAVVHLAGLSHVGRSWSAPAEYFQVNVLGSRNLLAAVAGRRLLVASSAEVYGAVPEAEQPIAEERSLAPGTPYALTKASLEVLARPAGATVVRAFNVVGPGQSTDFALPAFAAQLAAIRAGAQSPALAVGNLAARRDFVHVDDAVEAYRVLLAQGAPGEVYNLGGGEAASVEEALAGLIELSGCAVRVEPDPARFRPLDVPLLVADSGRLRALGWRPRRSLTDALADLWRATLAGPAAAGGR
jgi:GDP-4-dehydro-6-deoxy-D-mannose reductase